ncbi:MAG: hypothetical protein OXU44_02540, partial [Gammaproteobacteria bacterium]|nr:hypothetical protein [Gammaproteobacteria bacterium]
MGHVIDGHHDGDTDDNGGGAINVHDAISMTVCVVCESGAVSPAPDEYYKEWPPLYQQIVNGGP